VELRRCGAPLSTPAEEFNLSEDTTVYRAVLNCADLNLRHNDCQSCSLELDCNGIRWQGRYALMRSVDDRASRPVSGKPARLFLKRRDVGTTRVLLSGAVQPAFIRRITRK
jgi:hypothetical protein